MNKHIPLGAAEEFEKKRNEPAAAAARQAAQERDAKQTVTANLRRALGWLSREQRAKVLASMAEKSE